MQQPGRYYGDCTVYLTVYFVDKYRTPSEGMEGIGGDVDMYDLAFVIGLGEFWCCVFRIYTVALSGQRATSQRGKGEP
jgi:hypothetical protein